MAGMARAMGATSREAQKMLFFFLYSILNVYFAPDSTINCKAASTRRAHI